MLKRHTQIVLANANPGMTLADPILDTKGNLLLPEGTVLTQSILESLKHHQIDTIVITGAEISDLEESAEREQHLARVEKLFRMPTAITDSTTTPAAIVPTATEVLHQYIRIFRTGSN